MKKFSMLTLNKAITDPSIPNCNNVRDMIPEEHQLHTDVLHWVLQLVPTANPLFILLKKDYEYLTEVLGFKPSNNFDFYAWVADVGGVYQ